MHSVEHKTKFKLVDSVKVPDIYYLCGFTPSVSLFYTLSFSVFATYINLASSVSFISVIFELLSKLLMKMSDKEGH